jgi:peptidoglycan-N-acetylglucosamine deacetylase
LKNFLGIDFEEWYHPELIQKNIQIKNKSDKLVNGIDKILDWLRKNDVYATFFIVGELLERNLELMDKILQNDHEIAFHSMYHKNLKTQNKETFAKELSDFKNLTQKKSIGFRAPTFSLYDSNSWIIAMLEEFDYKYDSSIVPAKTQLYGHPNAETKPYRISEKNLLSDNDDGKIIEFPLLTTKFFGKTIPAGGGFYLRALPLKFIKNAIQINNSLNIPTSFYIHSWELTPEFMPKLQLPWKDKFITYYNLNNALPKMDKLLKNFEFTSFNRSISKFV